MRKVIKGFTKPKMKLPRSKYKTSMKCQIEGKQINVLSPSYG